MLVSDYITLFKTLVKTGVRPPEATVQIVVSMIEEIQAKQSAIRAFPEDQKITPEGQLRFAELAEQLGDMIIRKQSDWQDFVRAINAEYKSTPLSEHSFDDIIRKHAPQLLELADVVRKSRYDKMVARRKNGEERF